MFNLAVILTAFLSVSFGGPPPHADLVKDLQTAKPETRYSDDIISDALADVPELIAKYRYPVEVHNVVTADGYILELHRIPHGRDRNQYPTPGRPAVLVYHGLLTSSADFVMTGPGNALGYRLADEGYDVWLGNARGNYYSRNHTTLDPNDKTSSNFWKFSWDEMGNYDLPACIDYILETTGTAKLHYVGHSQGSTLFLVMASLRPEYNEKIVSFQGLAPAAFYDNFENAQLQFVAPYIRIMEILAFRFGFAEFLGRQDFFTQLGLQYCSEESLSAAQPTCLGIPVTGGFIGRINATMMPVFLGHAPAGISFRQLTHFGQSVRSKVIKRFDFGVAGNLARYGRLTPPAYDLKKITAPTYLHYSLSDDRVNYKDVYQLAEAVGNDAVLCQVADPEFTHLDFVWGVGQSEYLHGNIVEAMRLANIKLNGN